MYHPQIIKRELYGVGAMVVVVAVERLLIIAMLIAVLLYLMRTVMRKELKRIHHQLHHTARPGQAKPGTDRYPRTER